MGRFSSPDPQGNSYADFSNPQSWNMYAYVMNNPLKYTDPTGMYCDYSDHNYPSSGFDSSQFDYHSNSGECTQNQGQWVNDAYTHGGFDDYGRPDNAVSANVNTSTTPQPTANDAAKDFLNSTVPGQMDNLGNNLLFALLPKQIGGNPLSLTKPAPNIFFGTTNCGPGGGGSKTGTMNGPCAVHDACYGAVEGGGISAANNFPGGSAMTAGQIAGEKACNQGLYDAARNHPDAPGSKAVQWWMVNGSNLPDNKYILHPGTEAVPW